LGKEKVLGLSEVVAIIRSEESRRGLMLETPTTESSAMMTEGGSTMITNQRKNMTKFGVPIAISHATQERSAGNYMENLQAKNGGKKEVL